MSAKEEEETLTEFPGEKAEDEQISIVEGSSIRSDSKDQDEQDVDVPAASCSCPYIKCRLWDDLVQVLTNHVLFDVFLTDHNDAKCTRFEHIISSVVGFLISCLAFLPLVTCLLRKESQFWNPVAHFLMVAQVLSGIGTAVECSQRSREIGQSKGAHPSVLTTLLMGLFVTLIAVGMGFQTLVCPLKQHFFPASMEGTNEPENAEEADESVDKSADEEDAHVNAPVCISEQVKANKELAADVAQPDSFVFCRFEV